MNKSALFGATSILLLTLSPLAAQQPTAGTDQAASTNLQSWTNAGSTLAAGVANSVVVQSTTGDVKRYWRLRRGQ